ncbi:MAG: MFS transporter [Pseudomonadota bacterium]
MTIPPQAPSDPPSPLPRQAVRNARIVIVLAILVAVVCSNAPAPLLALYQQQWQFSALMLTAVFVTYAAGVLVPLLLSDRIVKLAGGGQKLVALALVMVTLGALVFAFAQGLGWLLAGRFLSGLGTGSLVGPANAALVRTFSPARRNLGMVLGSVAFTAGAAAGPVLSGVALAFNAWPTVLPFALIGVTAAFGAFAVTKITWPDPDPSPAKHDDSVMPPEIPVTVAPRQRRRTFVLVALVTMLSWAIAGTLMTLGPLMALQLANIQSRAEIAGIIAAFQAAAGICQIVTARRNSLLLARNGTIIITLAFAGCTLAAWLNQPILFGLCFILAGVGNGATFAGSAGLLIQVAEPARRSRSISMLYVAGYIGNAIPVLIMGVLVDRFGLLAAMFTFVTLMALGTPLLVSKLREYKG